MTGRHRCWGDDDDLLREHHDRAWGRPVTDERELFERLCLEVFQAGLSWSLILRRRPGLRRAFHGFEPRAVAAMTADDVARLLLDPAVIRHRGKIEATIANARAVLALRAAGSSLGELLWSHRPPPRPAPRNRADVPTSTPAAAALAAELRRRGFRFLGPTSVYALMQDVGLVNDHLATCCVRAEVEAAQAALPRVGPT